MNLPTATASYHQRTDGNTNPQEENFTRQDEQQIRNRSQSAGDNLTLICLRPQQAIIIVLMGPSYHEEGKPPQCGFRPGSTQTGLYKHRRWLEA